MKRVLPISALAILLSLMASLVPSLAVAAPTAPLAPVAPPAVSDEHSSFTALETLPDASPEQDALVAGRRLALAEAPVGAPTAIAGITWPRGAAAPIVLYRSVTADKATAWEEIHADDDTPGEASKTDGTQPVILTGVASVQVAIATKEPLEARLSVYASAEASTDAVAPATRSRMVSTQAVSAAPTIRSRSEWGANEAIVGLPYTYGIVSGVMIHHTADGNSYTATQVPGLLRSIQAYHVNSRGWKDIAYNILVDKFGTAWEGRGGGITQAVEGGHALGETNRRVFGLSLLGNYEDVQPSSVMIEKAKDIIAWKFSMHGVNPYGTTWGSGGQDGGSTFLNAISGHRDENATTCPGRHVYALLPSIRADVKARLSGVNYTVTQPQPTPPSAPMPTPDPVTGKYTVPENGLLDKGTVGGLQRWLGVSSDGVWGSGTTRALQTRLGIAVTGVRDAATIVRLQQHLGSAQTGLLDPGTILALQRFLNALPAPNEPVIPTTGKVVYSAHVSGTGWQRDVADNAVAGTTGQARSVEALRVSVAGAPAPGDIQMRAHVATLGWQPWVTSATLAGTTGRRLAIEAFEIKLTGTLAQTHDLRYRAHVSEIGWQPYTLSGGLAGTTGRGLPIEAIQIELVTKAPPVGTRYAAHVAELGWMAPVTNGQTAGTTGRALALQGLGLSFDSTDTPHALEWRGHVAEIGWQPWTGPSVMLGTTGRNLRLEAFQIRLTGPLATTHTLRYRAHVQDIGWQPWVADGAVAGTTQQAKAIEAVEITIVRK